MTNGESDFESRGYTDSYEADYISVQCLDGIFGAICMIDLLELTRIIRILTCGDLIRDLLDICYVGEIIVKLQHVLIVNGF